MISADAGNVTSQGGALDAADKRRDRTFVATIWAFGVLLLLVLLATQRISPGGRSPVKISGIDSVCYFATAHSLLFDGDFDLTNEFAILHPLKSPWTGTVQASGRPGSPFPIGMSILEMPFLAAGHVIARLRGGPQDGYSGTYIAAYFAGLIVFLIVGLLVSYRFLVQLAQEWGASVGRAQVVAFAVTLCLWPATTLAYYTFSPMAHVPAFMACALFLLLWWRARRTNNVARWSLAGAALGLLFLCRWQGLLFGIIPLMDEVWGLHNCKISPNSWLGARAIALFSLLIATLPQLLQWKAIYGLWLTIPQGDGFMEFPPHHSLAVLLSTRHGWFVWTPITLLGVIGLLAGAVKRFEATLAFLVVLALEVLVIGCLVHAWSGHEAFGMRFLTDCSSLVGAGLVWLLLRSRRTLVIVALAVLLCSAWTLAFAVQYRLDLLPKDDRLTLRELVFDKLFLTSAIRRHRMATRVAGFLENGDARLACELAATYSDDPNPNREWAALQVKLGELTGEPGRLAAARRHQREFEEHKLP